MHIKFLTPLLILGCIHSPEPLEESQQDYDPLDTLTEEDLDDLPESGNEEDDDRKEDKK